MTLEHLIFNNDTFDHDMEALVIDLDKSFHCLKYPSDVMFTLEVFSKQYSLTVPELMLVSELYKRNMGFQ